MTSIDVLECVRKVVSDAHGDLIFGGQYQRATDVHQFSIYSDHRLERSLLVTVYRDLTVTMFFNGDKLAGARVDDPDFVDAVLLAVGNFVEKARRYDRAFAGMRSRNQWLT